MASSFRPAFALFDSCARWLVAVYGVAGILRQKFAGDVGTLPAVFKALILTAGSYRAFSVKRVSVGLDAAAAAVRLFKSAVGAVQPAPRIDFIFVHF